MTVFRVITVSREYGSGGGEIARRLADRLHWQLLDRCLIEKIAEAAQVEPSVATKYDERTDPWFNELLKGFWYGGLEGFAVPPRRDVFDASSQASLTQQLIRRAAEIGHCVIVGRGSQCVLQDRADTFRIAIYAPYAERIARIRRRRPELDRVEEALHSTDYQRIAYIRRNFGHDASDRHLYHLMISSTLGEEAVVSTILSAMHAAEEGAAVPHKVG